MPRMVLRVDHRVKVKLRRMRRETRDKGLAQRCQIVLLAGNGRQRGPIAEAVGVSVSWVNRVIRRFKDHGIAGLEDRRQDNGALKVDEHYLSALMDVVAGSPQDYGHRRAERDRDKQRRRQRLAQKKSA